MTSYAHLTTIEAIFMTIIAALTNFAGIPLVIKVFNKDSTHFEGFVFAMSILTSFLYHICQIYDCTIFLSELQWHRLDNIFAITSFQLMILRVSGSLTSQDTNLRWSTLLSSLIIQQKDPWEVKYTIFPCIFYIGIALIIRFYRRNTTKVKYNKRKMYIGISALCVGIFFFVDGLDDPNDYLRISHGIWHVCASAFGYFCIQAVDVKYISKTQKESGSDQSIIDGKQICQ